MPADLSPATPHSVPVDLRAKGQGCPVSPSQARHHLLLDQARSGWTLLMQSGVGIDCAIGIPLQELLLDELGVPEEHLKRIDVLILDGKPVDSPASALVPDGARLALAAGLPGIAGLAMKSNSPVRGLRPGITHNTVHANAGLAPGSGSIELVLYSLAIPLLGEHFLSKGVAVTCGQLLHYLRPAPEERYLLDNQPLSAEELRQTLDSLPASARISVTAAFSV